MQGELAQHRIELTGVAGRVDPQPDAVRAVDDVHRRGAMGGRDPVHAFGPDAEHVSVPRGDAHPVVGVEQAPELGGASQLVVVVGREQDEQVVPIQARQELPEQCVAARPNVAERQVEPRDLGGLRFRPGDEDTRGPAAHGLVGGARRRFGPTGGS